MKMISKLIFLLFLVQHAKSQFETLSSSGIRTTTQSTKTSLGTLSSGIILSTTTTHTSSSTTSISAVEECPDIVKAICLNESTCQTIGRSFMCVCRTGYRNYDCSQLETFYCETYPCKNGSTCIQMSLTSGVCFCNKEHSGTYCETLV